MMEKNTDRLFWTLTSIIVGALLLTISVKAFPGVANSIVKPISGITKQADTSTKTSDQAYKDAINGVNGGSSNNSSGSNSGSSQSSQPTDPDAQAKANAVEASTLNLKVTPNGDGTGVLSGKVSGIMNGNLNIPEYVKVNGQLTKITSIANNALSNNNLSSVSIPDGVTSIGASAFSLNLLNSVTIPNSVKTIGYAAFSSNLLKSINIPNGVTIISDIAFSNNQLTSVNIPNSVTYIGFETFAFQSTQPYQLAQLFPQNNQNTLTSVNIPNQQAYQSAQNNRAFGYNSTTTVTNNPSN